MMNQGRHSMQWRHRCGAPAWWWARRPSLMLYCWAGYMLGDQVNGERERVRLSMRELIKLHPLMMVLSVRRRRI
ncbi:hypothetical protein E2C01_064903 [Portunus trituberculatus]|uniref:Uncharacterized protein n=1 Tax=Portunus trituberculatus TaxID=210409 RepID=A0A5B7HPN6_PORTR|nr:hypothetical protein [Portunus trituberculatus]